MWWTPSEGCRTPAQARFRALDDPNGHRIACRVDMNLAILHAGALGDCVLTLHVAMALRAAGHRVTVAARSPIAAWAARRGMIDDAIALEKLAPLLWGTDHARMLERE